jgi:hypothetical protein
MNNRHPHSGLESFSKQVDGVLQDRRAVRNGHSLPRLPTFEKNLGTFEKNLREVQAYIHTLTATRRVQPAAAVTDTLQSDAVHDIATLRMELNRLADEVVGMSEVVGLMSRHEGKP